MGSYELAERSRFLLTSGFHGHWLPLASEGPSMPSFQNQVVFRVLQAFCRACAQVKEPKNHATCTKGKARHCILQRTKTRGRSSENIHGVRI